VEALVPNEEPNKSPPLLLRVPIGASNIETEQIVDAGYDGNLNAAYLQVLGNCIAAASKRLVIVLDLFRVIIQFCLHTNSYFSFYWSI